MTPDRQAKILAALEASNQAKINAIFAKQAKETKHMRIASLILPTRADTPVRHDAAHQYVRHRLLALFGGFTRSEVSGAWVAPDKTVHYDQSLRYEIAADWSKPYNRPYLSEIALKAGQIASQQCVLVVWDDGEVEFINMEQK